MMGRQTGDQSQSQLFYLFNLERRIPAGHVWAKQGVKVEWEDTQSTEMEDQ